MKNWILRIFGTSMKKKPKQVACIAKNLLYNDFMFF